MQSLVDTEESTRSIPSLSFGHFINHDESELLLEEVHNNFKLMFYVTRFTRMQNLKNEKKSKNEHWQNSKATYNFTYYKRLTPIAYNITVTKNDQRHNINGPRLQPVTTRIDAYNFTHYCNSKTYKKLVTTSYVLKFYSWKIRYQFDFSMVLYYQCMSQWP